MNNYTFEYILGIVVCFWDYVISPFVNLKAPLREQLVFQKIWLLIFVIVLNLVWNHNCTYLRIVFVWKANFICSGKFRSPNLTSSSLFTLLFKGTFLENSQSHRLHNDYLMWRLYLFLWRHFRTKCIPIFTSYSIIQILL